VIVGLGRFAVIAGKARRRKRHQEPLSMLIPWGTDAPIYHRPIATIALIVVNVLLFLVAPSGTHEDWALVLGNGVHPLQWVTNIFMHAGLLHLFGNMIFLWTFGLIVEGKLGFWRFLIVYLGLGALASAGMQLLVGSAQEVHMLGASAVIFGLLALCLVWAPRNEVSCILWLRTMPMDVDVSILWFVVLYIAFDVLTASLKAAVMAGSSAASGTVILALLLDHAIGAILGFVLGVALLKLKLVDCEHWDLFAVLEGRAGRSRKQADNERVQRRSFSTSRDRANLPAQQRKRPTKERKPTVMSIEDPSAARLRSMRRHITLGEIEAAFAVYQKARRAPGGWQPPESDRRDLIEGLLERNEWAHAVHVMRDSIRELADPPPRIRLKLAQILIQKLGRPLQGLRVLGEIPEGSLPDSLEPLRRKLVRHAEAVQEEGPLELEEEA
jgi:membrane associated rhomboid family serine protease